MPPTVGSLPVWETEAAEAEYLTARIAALGRLPDNPYNAELHSQGPLRAFLVRSTPSSMMNRICGDCRGSPHDLSELVGWFAVQGCIPSIPLTFQSGKPPPRERIGTQDLRRLTGWTHVQLTAYTSELSVQQSDLKVEELTSANVEAFIGVHAEAFRTPMERQAVNRACFSHLIANDRIQGFLIWMNGEPAAGAIVYFAANGVAYFGTAATRRMARGRGCHSALIGRRVTAARQRGCQFVAATATPNSPSRRNLERLGFTASHVQALYSPEDVQDSLLDKRNVR